LHYSQSTPRSSILVDCWCASPLGPPAARVMYGMDQTLPAWTAALDPVDLLWNDSSSVCEPSQQEAASVVCFPSASQSSARPVPNSTQPGIQAQSGAAASTQQHQMWEPVPFAPDDFRAEVFNLLTAPALTTARPQPEVQPTEQEHSQSAPTSSGFIDGTEDSKQRDMSALSRTRSQTNTSEQKQANARQSQKRFRMRQKVFIQFACLAVLPAYLGRSLSDVVTCISCNILHKAALPPLLTLLLLPQARSQAIEAQLASTVAELCNLRVRQQHLESRNQLLEKCSSLTKSQNSDQVSGLRFSSVRDGLTGMACLTDCIFHANYAFCRMVHMRSCTLLMRQTPQKTDHPLQSLCRENATR